MSQSDAINELAAALAKAQGQMSNAAKDRVNPAFKSRYADLASVRDAVAGPLSQNGIAFIQRPRTTEQGVEVETMLVHASGQWIASTISAAPKGYDPQSIGSCVTYLRRYGLMALCGIAPDDDDGNAASGRSDGPPAWQGRHDAPQRVTAPAPTPAPAPAAKWTDGVRKAFCGDLDKIGISYDNVAAYCESLGRPRPSVMGPDQRSVLVAALLGAGRARFDAFLAAPPVEVANDHR
jgi:hypothetical protein